MPCALYRVNNSKGTIIARNAKNRTSGYDVSVMVILSIKFQQIYTANRTSCTVLRNIETIHCRYISRYLVLVNAAINPLLYGCSSSSLRKELAIYPATSWLIRKKKQEESKPCSVSQLKPENVHDLRPRSPYIRTNYTDRNTIPNIASTVI